ncbi:PilW family protein [Oceanisphaera sp. W20_SRM_FM3]|uniref:PilW family protein n=1 Tax=Oceanisphaera sp. W20_SRM_FM3 TaxID=3240267 RepID=UPI003F9BDD5E
MRGFTLIELVIVMMILGIVSVFSVRFITSSVQIYRQGADRESLMSDVRFGIERLNREVRNAVPGSLLIEDTGNCVRFWPITNAGRYIGALSSGTESTKVSLPMSVPASEQDAWLKSWQDKWLIINSIGLDSSTQTCATGYDCAVKVVTLPTVEESDKKLTFSFASKPQFSSAPAKRVYFANEQVRYCVNNAQQLTRAVSPISEEFTSESILMAEHISIGYFSINNDGLYSTLNVDLTVSKNNESIDFRHKIRLYNAP